MELNNRYKLFTLGLLFLGVSSCDEQEVAAIRTLDTKPNITITRIDENASNPIVMEGDILEFEVKTDRMMESAVNFSAISSTLLADLDYEVLSGGVIAPYTNSSIMVIQIIEDNFPELDEASNLVILPQELAQNWQLHPNSLEGTAFNYTVKNVNPLGAISFGFLWADDHDDFDVYIYSQEEDDYWGDDIYESATGNYPEVSAALKNEDPDGTYYITVDPYDVAHDASAYTVSVGFEDGSSQVFTGTLNLKNADHPMIDGLYHLLTIVKNGSTATVTHITP